MLQNDFKFEKKFSLDFRDAEAAKYTEECLRQDPRRLNRLIGQDPMVATRVFHWTVRLVLITLFNCCDKPGERPDGIASAEVPGVFGHVRAYLGVVEPQMRKALHIHMLVQLLGFSHPDDLFKSDLLETTFREVWSFVASITFRSTEGVAHYLRSPEAMQTLQGLPLLPFSKSQRVMIGEERVAESEKQQLEARGLDKLPKTNNTLLPIPFYPSATCAIPQASAAQWVTEAVKEIFTRTRTTGNHVCRPAVCHKGRIGKKGFCRMYYWHWVRQKNNKNMIVAKRRHGVSLHKRLSRQGLPPICKTPPHLGAVALETTHPFHL